MEQEIINKIGKRGILDDDIRFDYKLTYVAGIDSFDAHFSDGSKEKERSRIMVSKYPKGLLLRIDTSKSKVNFGLSYESIKYIRVDPLFFQSPILSVVFVTANGDISFELMSKDLGYWEDFVKFFSKHLKNLDLDYKASQKSIDGYGEAEDPMAVEGGPHAHRYRYPALRTIAVVYMVLAWVIGVVTVIALFYFISEENIVQGVISIIAGGLLALGLAAISEIIKVFLDIEYNTRVSAMHRND